MIFFLIPYPEQRRLKKKRGAPSRISSGRIAEKADEAVAGWCIPSTSASVAITMRFVAEVVHVVLNVQAPIAAG